MTYRRVQAELTWEGKPDRDTFAQNIKNKLDNHPHHDRNESHLVFDETPKSGVDVRPEQAADADEIYAYIKKQIDTIPALRGTVRIHDCDHDEEEPTPCSPEKTYSA